MPPRHTARRAAAGGPAQTWETVQRTGVQALYARKLVGGHVDAVDGSGLGPDLRVVALVCVSAQRPLIVAWRLLEGDASEKGKEASVTRGLVEQALALGGAGCMRLLLTDALYADGPLLAWLTYVQGIDALAPLPEDRLLYADVSGLAAGGLIPWTEHRYTRTLQGHKQLRRVAVASAGDLTSWDGFVAAAAQYGAPDATLWACLIRETDAPPGAPLPRCLVSTRPWADGFAALQAYRPRWHSEDDTYRELKEGWGLEEQRWGRDRAAARPSHPDLPGRQHRPGLPYPRRGAAGPAGHPPPAPCASARSGRRPRRSLRGGLLRRAGPGGPARRARPACA